MSEDGRVRFGEGPPVQPDRVSVSADGPAMARRIEAAGWPATVSRDADGDRPAFARIHAFDWRVQVPAVSPARQLPTDCAILCLVSLETIDAADALLSGCLARFVFGDAAALLATELSDLNSVLHSHSAFETRRDERARLQALAMELARLAEQLGSLSSSDEGADRPGTIAERNMDYQAELPSDHGPAIPPDPQRIRHLISIRRLRDRFFSAELFADPAWDILLDLAASRLEHRAVSVSSLCIAAAVPPTTALRWIRMMTDQGLLVRRADPMDARRMFMELSDGAFDQLCGWLALVDARGGLGG